MALDPGDERLDQTGGVKQCTCSGRWMAESLAQTNCDHLYLLNIGKSLLSQEHGVAPRSE